MNARRAAGRLAEFTNWAFHKHNLEELPELHVVCPPARLHCDRVAEWRMRCPERVTHA